MAIQKLRIFISSPGDVGQERLIATRVVDRLKGEFAGYAELEPILWEHEPLRATSHFQEQIVPPSQTDIVVCILWSRLGTRLPEQFKRDDGSSYSSGTEWEFEDAAKSFIERGAPDLMVYRKTNDAVTSLTDEQAILDRLSQKKALESFIDRWFGNAQSTFKAAFHTFASPDKFEETIESHLRNLIRERLPTHMAEGDGMVPISWHKGSPYRGLEAFDVEHAPVFFGRTRAIGEIKDALVQRASSGCAFLVVFGMSGSGKSSLVRAGVLPTLAQPGVAEGIGLWRWAIFRPSDAADDVLKGLAQALLMPGALPELEADGLDAFELAALFREAPQRAVGPLRMGLKRAAEVAAKAENLDKPLEARLAVVIDQMEELFTLEHLSVEERTAFVATLSALAHSGLVWVMGTMRSDFYPRCAEIPELIALKEGPGQYDLLPPTFAEIGQMIRQPTRAAGLRFETDPKSGERLDDALHEAATRNPEGLPLLEFTLDELYKERSEAGVLTFAAYRTLGGIEGALARRAEDVFLSLEPSVQAILPEVLRALVTVEDGERLARRRVPLDVLASTAERKTLLNAFIGARLLVTDRADNGEAVVGVAHEALLRHWPRLEQWLAEDREFLLTRERVADAAGHWLKQGKTGDLLLHEGRPLVEAVDLLERRRSDLDPAVAGYIELSRRKWAGLRRRKLFSIAAITAAFFIVVSSFGMVSFRQWQRAEKQKQLALGAINAWTRDIPDKLKDVPGTLPVLKEIFQKNVGVLDEILKLNPQTPEAMREKALNFEHSGDTWRVLGATQDALGSYEKSFAIFADIARRKGDSQARRDLSASYEHIGDTRLEIGDLDGAAKAYEEGLKITLALAEDKKDAGSRRDLSVSYEKIGDARWQKGDQKKALEAYEQSLAIRRDLARDPNNTQAARDLSVSHEKVGNMWLALSQTQKALEAYQKSLALRAALATRKPSIEAQRDLAIAHTNIGDVQKQLGNGAAALAAYEKSHAILTYLGRDRLSVRAQLGLAVSFSRLADTRIAMGDVKGGLNDYRQCLAIATELAKDKSNVQAQHYAVEMFGNLSWVELSNRHPKEAIVAATRALQMDSSQTWIKVNLAHGYLFDNQYERAMIAYLKNEDAKLADGRTFGEVALADFKEFKGKGLLHPNMAQIELLLLQARKS